VELTSNHGRYIILGLWGQIGTSTISPRDFAIKNMMVQGATLPKPKHYSGAMRLAARLQVRYAVADLITHRFAVRDAADALQAVESGIAIKAVVDPTL
jgi:5-exo-hydroxycamphor dehydrogenase